MSQDLESQANTQITNGNQWGQSVDSKVFANTLYLILEYQDYACSKVRQKLTKLKQTTSVIEVKETLFVDSTNFGRSKEVASGTGHSCA